MGSIFDLATDDRDALDEAARLNPLDPAKLGPSAFAGTVQQAKGLLRPSAGAGRTILMSGAPVAQAMDWIANLNPSRPADQRDAWASSYFQGVDDLGSEAVEYWTPNAGDYGTAAKTVGVLSNVVGSLPQMLGTPTLFLANAGMDPATELVRQGVTDRFGERLIERYGHRLPPRFRRDQMDSQTMAAQMQTDVSEAGGGTTP